MAGPSPVNVYVPVEGTDVHKLIDPGSGIVGQRIVPEDDESPIHVFYEGNRFNYANVVTYADRCMIAEGRQRENAPTIAKMLVRPGDVLLVGTYHPDERRVQVRSGLELTKLAKWLGLASLVPDGPQAGALRWNGDTLAVELCGSRA